MQEDIGNGPQKIGFWSTYLDYFGVGHVVWPVFFAFLAALLGLHITGILGLFFGATVSFAANTFFGTVVFLLLLPMLYPLLARSVEAILKINIVGVSEELTAPQKIVFNEYKTQSVSLRECKKICNTLILALSLYTTLWFFLSLVGFNLVWFVVLLALVMPFISVQFMIFFILTTIMYGASKTLESLGRAIGNFNKGVEKKLLKLIVS